MRPARKGPENTAVDLHGIKVVAPSMRPARKGPENIWHGSSGGAGRPAFNEAGPQGAGKRRRGRRTARQGRAFNEAGPQGAGKLERAERAAHTARPSMRPARKGPENIHSSSMSAGNALALQ